MATSSHDSLTSSAFSVTAVPITVLQIFIPIMAWGIINNSLLVIMVIREKIFHKPTFYLLCNQAIANVICLASILTFSLIMTGAVDSPRVVNVTLQQSIKFEGIRSSCSLTFMFYQSSYTVSVLSLAVIAFDRHRVLTNYNKKNYSTKSILIINTFIWIIGCVNGYFYSTFIGHNRIIKTLCDFNFDSILLARIYFAINFVLTYLIPAIIIITSYSLIIRYIRMERSEIASIDRIKRKRRNHIIEMAMVTSLVFLIPTTPWAIYSLILAFFQFNVSSLILRNNYSLIVLLPVFQFLYYTTCVTTPCLVASYNRIIKSIFVSIYLFFLPKKWQNAVVNFKVLSCKIFHSVGDNYNQSHSVAAIAAVK